MCCQNVVLSCDYEVKLHTGGVGRPARRIASELTLLLMLVLMMLALLLCREDAQDEFEVKLEDEVDEAEEDEEVGGVEECKEYLGSGEEV